MEKSPEQFDSKREEIKTAEMKGREKIESLLKGSEEAEESNEIMKVNISETFESLRTIRERIVRLLEECGGQEKYNKFIESYIDSLSDIQLLELSKELREKIVDDNSSVIKPYLEFNIDPFVQDLTKHTYSHPITFSKKAIREIDGEIKIENSSLGGFYRRLTGEIVVYIPDPQNELDLEKFLENTEKPNDLKRRIKHFLKKGTFGLLVKVIQHELIHAEQNSSSGFHDSELFEAQAYEEALKSSRLISLTEKMFFFFSDGKSKEQWREALKKTYSPEEIEKIADSYSVSMSDSSGVSAKGAAEWIKKYYLKKFSCQKISGLSRM